MAADPLLPPRPALVPGAHVVRRDQTHLQVGLDPPRRAVLTDSPDTRQVLEDLSAQRRPQVRSADAAAGVRALLDAGLIVDLDELMAALDRAGTDRARREAVTALFAVDPDGAAVRLGRRAGVRVAVDAPDEVRRQLATHLSALGLPVTGLERQPNLTILYADTEITRDRVDRWMRRGVPHLVITATGLGLRLGPFVQPGVTACLRCLDAHLWEHDLPRPLVVEQLGRQGCDPGRLLARDPIQLAVALAWAAQDAACWAEGQRPTTWSVSIDLSAQGWPEPTTWRRHPHCGCNWADGLHFG